jgi:hypothetical protein
MATTKPAVPAPPKRSPWLCKAGVTLRDQINKAHPKRDKKSDGWIGDAAHAASKSDHNPAPPTNVVRAIDIDSDLDPAHETAAQDLANQLCKAALAGDKRILYVIFNRHIASAIYPTMAWKWRPYDGPDPHTSHIHISFAPAGDNDPKPFPI